MNIFLDLFCIVVLKWGCAGAAAATITAQAISGILCLVFIGRKMNVLHLTKENRMVNITAVKELLAMGLPTGLQFSITAIGSMVMQSANNGLGSVCVSGFTAGMRIKQFAMCPFDAIATSASVFCSQNMGARQPERIKKGLRQGVAIATIYGLLIGLVLIFGGRTLSMIFVKKSAADVLDASGKYLRCLGYFYWSLGILGDGDAGKNDRQSGICRSPGVYSNLLRGSGGMDRSMLLHSTDLPALRQKGDGDTGR